MAAGQARSHHPTRRKSVSWPLRPLSAIPSIPWLPCSVIPPLPRTGTKPFTPFPPTANKWSCYKIVHPLLTPRWEKTEQEYFLSLNASPSALDGQYRSNHIILHLISRLVKLFNPFTR